MVIGFIDENSQRFDLENWVNNHLFNQENNIQRRVIFILGGPGRGKSTFCYNYADFVRQDVYRRWIPILIYLRNITFNNNNLCNTLRSELDRCLTPITGGWLNDNNFNFLFILDGFDVITDYTHNLSIQNFIIEVDQFQRNYSRHQVIITGRPMALHSIDHLPGNLERVEIAEMDIELQSQWFDQWCQRYPTSRTREFQQFLQTEACPTQIQELAKEPLLLYMLTEMHQNGELDISNSQPATNTTKKILVYERALDFVLKRSNTQDKNLTLILTQQTSEELKQTLTEVAVCVVQSGGKSASMQTIQARFQQNAQVREIINRTSERLGSRAIIAALNTFYLKSNNSDGVEFIYKYFCEFLYAKKLQQRLEQWTRIDEHGIIFHLNEQQLFSEIYDLLGYGGLTPAIVEYLMGLLVGSNQFQPVPLFNRLKHFYLSWCQREFINAAPENLPQKKMRLLQEQNIRLDQHQVDIYAGLNVMILLLQLHRYAQGRDDLKQQIIYYPSGEPRTNSWTDQLLCNINYSNSFKLRTFNSVVGKFLNRVDLRGANLSHADLSGADLSGTDLSDANLSHADLSGVNFSNAILRDTILSRADLSRTNLSDVDFSNANLSRADLSCAILNSTYLGDANLYGANLYNVSLIGADFCGTNLGSAVLRDIHWDENTKWEGVRNLDTAINVPEALKQQLGLS